MSECVAQPLGQGRQCTQLQNGGEAPTETIPPPPVIQPLFSRNKQIGQDPFLKATIAKIGLTTGCRPYCLPSESTGKKKAQPRLQRALTKHWERDLMS